MVRVRGTSPLRPPRAGREPSGDGSQTTHRLTSVLRRRRPRPDPSTNSLLTVPGTTSARPVTVPRPPSRLEHPVTRTRPRPCGGQVRGAVGDDRPCRKLVVTRPRPGGTRYDNGRPKKDSGPEGMTGRVGTGVGQSRRPKVLPTREPRSVHERLEPARRRRNLLRGSRGCRESRLPKWVETE